MTDADSSANGTIVVSGTGRVAVDPDVAELRLGVAVSRPTVEAARAAAAEAMTAILAAVDGGRRRATRRPDDAPVGPAALRLPRRQGTDARRLRPRQHRRGDRRATWPTWARSSTARCRPARPASTACRSGSTTRARPSARRGSRPSPRREPGRRSWPRRPGVAIAGVVDIVEGGPPPTWPQPKAAQMLARGRCRDAGRGRHDRDLGHRDGDVPDRLRSRGQLAGRRRSAAAPRSRGWSRRPCRPRPRRSS